MFLKAVKSLLTHRPIQKKPIINKFVTVRSKPLVQNMFAFKYQVFTVVALRVRNNMSYVQAAISSSHFNETAEDIPAIYSSHLAFMPFLRYSHVPTFTNIVLLIERYIIKTCSCIHFWSAWFSGTTMTRLWQYLRGLPISRRILHHCNRVNIRVFSSGNDSFRHSEKSFSPQNNALQSDAS